MHDVPGLDRGHLRRDRDREHVHSVRRLRVGPVGHASSLALFSFTSTGDLQEGLDGSDDEARGLVDLPLRSVLADGEAQRSPRVVEGHGHGAEHVGDAVVVVAVVEFAVNLRFRA